MLKKLFYASASVLMFALAYHLEANTAADTYFTSSDMTGGVVEWRLVGNIFHFPTPAAHATWGQVKTGYRK
jgi:hypothetical protein